MHIEIWLVSVSTLSSVHIHVLKILSVLYISIPFKANLFNMSTFFMVIVFYALVDRKTDLICYKREHYIKFNSGICWDM